jgi:SAM-dependent methyltransferase
MTTRYRVVAALLLCAVLGACGRSAQNTSTQSPAVDESAYTFGQPSAGGTGKFYMGREIPEINGPPDASWLDRTSREAEEHTEKVAANLDLKPTDVVADIGAGTGFFTFRLNPLVPHGMVYAEDIDPDMIKVIDRRKGNRNADNVTTVLGTITDPKLPKSSVDLVLLVETYHAFTYPKEMMQAIRAAMKPGARLVVIEHREATPPENRLEAIPKAQLVAEIEAAGFTLIDDKDVLPVQNFLVFRKPDGA